MKKANSLTTVQSDSEVLLVSKKAYPVTATYAGACPRDFIDKSHRELVIADNGVVYLWRKLTVKECERLQTLADGYTEGVSDSRRYKAIGNGWTVEVIAWIMKHFIF